MVWPVDVKVGTQITKVRYYRDINHMYDALNWAILSQVMVWCLLYASIYQVILTSQKADVTSEAKYKYIYQENAFESVH